MNLSQTKTLIVISSNAKTKSASSTSMLLHSPARTYGEFENQLKLIPVMAFNTPDTATLMKSLFPPKSSPSSVQTRNLLPRLFRILSKSSTAPPSPIPKPGGHGTVLSKSSTKKLTTLSPSAVKKFNVQTQGVLSTRYRPNDESI